MLSRRLAVSTVPFAKMALGISAPSASVLARRLASHDGPPANFKFPTMDELPVPCGSWQEHYDNNQRKYNIHLLLGTGFFLITLITGIYSGALDLYLFAPDKPAPRKAN